MIRERNDGGVVSRRTVLRDLAVGIPGGVAAQMMASASAGAAEGTASNGRGRLKQSISQWCYNGKLSMEQLIAEAVRIGYSAIELVDRKHWDAIRKAGLRIAAVGGHGTLTNGLNRRENHARIEEEIRKNLDLAAHYGIPNLICFPGNRSGLSDEEGMKTTVEGLKRVARVAEEKEITLVMELLNSKVDHKDYQADHTEWGVEVCKRVGSPRVKLLYDIYHMQIMEGDLIRTITKNIEYIGHFHTGGNPGRNEIDETQEIYYPAVLKCIADKGYTGYVGHEFVPKGNPVKALERAFEICTV